MVAPVSEQTRNTKPIEGEPRRGRATGTGRASMPGAALNMIAETVEHETGWERQCRYRARLKAFCAVQAARFEALAALCRSPITRRELQRKANRVRERFGDRWT